MEQYIINQFMISIRPMILLITNMAVAFTIVCKILKKRKSLTVWFSYHIVKILLVNMLFGMLLEDLIIQYSWMQMGYMTVAAASNILSYVVFWYTFQGSFAKVFLVSMLVETSTVVTSSIILVLVNVLEKRENLLILMGPFQWMDLLYVVLYFLLLLAVLKVFNPALKKLGDFQMKHEKFWWMIFFIYVSAALMSMSVKYHDTLLAMMWWVLLFCVVSCIALGFLVVHVFQAHSRQVIREHDYLKAQQKLMRVHYDTIRQQINQMEQYQNTIHLQMKEILKLEDTAEGNKRISDYLKKLKSEYLSITAGIYCDDWIVDSILCYQSQICREKGIETDFSFRDYEKGSMKDEDISEILILLLDTFIQNNLEQRPGKKISLTAGTVKNQMILRAESGWEEKKKFPIRRFKPYIRRYNGHAEIKKTDGKLKVEMILLTGKR